MEDELSIIITNIVKRVLPVDISEEKLRETPFAEMPLNSFEFIKIIVDIEEEIEIEVEPDKLDIGAFKDIRNLANYISYLVSEKNRVWC